MDKVDIQMIQLMKWSYSPKRDFDNGEKKIMS